MFVKLYTVVYLNMLMIFNGVAFSFQVNAGPLAYARAFLDDTNTKRYADNKIKQLKEVFR